MKTVKSIVQGSIHGVGFKYFVLKTALRHHISGYVKNEKDGTISIIAYGQDQKVDEFFKVVEAGNGYSQIDFITLSESPIEIYREFRVIY